jgi:taurine dioxygenase
MGHRVEPLAENCGFGALITDLDRDALEDPAVAKELHDLWTDCGVLVIRGLPNDQHTHVRLGECFGEIEVHPLSKAREGLLPEIVDVYAGEEDGDIYDLGDGDVRAGWLPWHFDLCYSDKINHGGILRAVSLPPAGGKTGFIDHIAAYATLPQPLRERIEGLYVLYEMEFDASKMRFARTPGISTVRQQARTIRFAGRAHELPRAAHPMVYRQPGTGRPILHVSPWFAAGIEGHEDEEGNALLDEVMSYVCNEELAYYHVWEPDDYVMWDNWRMMHCATGVPVGQTRHLQRVALAGDPRMGHMNRGAKSEAEKMVM